MFYVKLKEKVKDNIYKKEQPPLFNNFVKLTIKANNHLYKHKQEKGNQNFKSFNKFNNKLN